jgi:hypothetical protein
MAGGGEVSSSGLITQLVSDAVARRETGSSSNVSGRSGFTDNKRKALPKDGGKQTPREQYEEPNRVITR